MKKVRPGTNAKDLVFYWSRKYTEVIGRKYLIQWVRDGCVFKRLLARYKARDIKRVIDFAFSNDDRTTWFRNQGYPIGVFPTVFNQFFAAIEKPWQHIDRYELDIDTHYSVDYRTEWIWNRIVDGNIDALLCNLQDSYHFHLLMAKIEATDKGIPPKVLLYYEMWSEREPLDRTRIHHCDN